jgi:hypothetical protein
VPTEVHVTTNESAIIIADNSTGKIGQISGREMGVNVTVYKFASADDVPTNWNTPSLIPIRRSWPCLHRNIQNFINQHPEVSSRIMVASSNKNSIQQTLTKLNVAGATSSGFLTPLLSGLLIGLVFGLGIGAVWMKRKLS